MWHLVLRLTLLLTTALGLVATVYGWRYLHHPTTFPIQTVRVKGTFNHINPHSIRKVALPYVKTGYFQMDIRALHRAINNIAWIERSQVALAWPGIVSISFIEQVPIVRWGDDALLNSRGEIFKPEVSSIPQQLPRVYGDPKRSREILESYRIIHTNVQKLSLRIDYIRVYPSGSWQVNLTNGLILRLARSNIQDSMKRFTESYTKVFKSNVHAVESVDLRYVNGMAVKWRPAQKKNKSKQEQARRVTTHVKKTG